MNNRYKSYNITISSLLVCYGVLLKCFMPRLPIVGGSGSIIVILMIISMYILNNYNYTFKMAILIIIISNFMVPDIIVLIIGLIDMMVSYLIIIGVKNIIKNRDISIIVGCVICNTFVVFILFVLVVYCRYVEYYKYALILMTVFIIIGVTSGIIVNKILKIINR